VRLFEDVETSMVELRKRLLNLLYIWIASHHCLNDLTYVDFLNLFSSRSIYGLSCILPVYKGCAFLCY
jgi:hemerythrin